MSVSYYMPATLLGTTRLCSSRILVVFANKWAGMSEPWGG